MDIILIPLLNLANFLLGLVLCVVIFSVALEWLFSWGILNFSNYTVYRFYSLLKRILDPMINFVGRYIPTVAGFDLSALVVILLILFIRNVSSMILIKLAI
ncbi:MAG: YggT family protein [Holosporales bacterium]|nr:YggT family protein [Holosporales bacterium]